MKKIVLLIFILLLAVSCANINQVGESTMNEPLLTSEEFLELVSRYEEILGVTVADFDDIDIEDFIEWNNLTEYVFYGFIDGGMIFLPGFNQYVSMLGTRAKEAYLPTERRMVDSTEEELEQFKAQFFEKIGGEAGVEHVNTVEMGLVERYSFMDGGERDRFIMGRTMHLERLVEEHSWRFTSIYGVLIPFNDMEHGTAIYISRNGKFFIAFDSFWPRSIETIQAFMEIED